MSDWRYFAQRLDGKGGVETIHPDLPLRSVAITSTLSGPGALSAEISPEVFGLKGEDGRPIFREWSTAIWAEKDGMIRGGGILSFTAINGHVMQLECVGFSGYLRELPYVDDKFFIEADPMDIARHIWEHAQQQKNGNLGVTLGTGTSPTRIGTKLLRAEYDPQTNSTPPAEGTTSTTFESGPYKLNWWTNFNMQADFDAMATRAPFEYAEQLTLDPNTDAVRMHLHMEYPKIGARREDLRFVMGENVSMVPPIDYAGDEFANAVVYLGAGEGRTMIRGETTREDDNRLRRVAVVQDKAVRSKAEAVNRSRNELALRSGEFSVTDIVVRDHPHAVIGSWAPGDEILIEAETGWADFSVWCRIVSSTIRPDDGDTATLTIMRTDKVQA